MRIQLTENEFVLLVMKVSCILGCVSKFIARRLTEVVTSLHSAFMTPQLEYHVKVSLSVQQTAESKNWRELITGDQNYEEGGVYVI